MAKRTAWGGRREGAGRPSKYAEGPAVPISGMIPEEVRTWLERRAAEENVSVSEALARVLVRVWKRSR